MPPTTCYGYSKRYSNYEIFKKNIIRHAKQNGVIIDETNELERSIKDFVKVMPKAMSQKRPRSSLEDKSDNFPVDAKQMSQKRLCISLEETIEGFPAEPSDQSIKKQDFLEQDLGQSEKIQTKLLPNAHEQQAEQQMADAAPVPKVQFEQPIADVTLVPIIEYEQPMAQMPVLVQKFDNVTVPTAIAHSTAHLPNANGAPKPLVLNGLVIEVDPDTFMVNATMMCKAAGKRWFNYMQLDCAKSYIKALESKAGISALDLIRSNRGGDHSGTMVHRLIAYDLASWLSNDVKLQFYMWIGELRIENAELSTQIEDLRANAVPVSTAIAPSTPLTIAHNGARRPLVLNGVTIEVDPVTLMVNATQMCKAAGKLYAHYSSTVEMTEFVKTLSSTIGIPIVDLVRSIPGHYGGTVVHRRVAMYLAQRLSPVFNVQVTGYLDELLLTGRVEKTVDALLVPMIQPEQPIMQALLQESDAPPASGSNGTYKPLVLNGIAIEVDPVTLMVNATQMCKAAGKLFGGYYRQKSTNDYLKALSFVMRIHITKLVVINQGGKSELQGTWVHRRVALHLAQSISPVFAAHVTGWIEQLFTTGRVELGNEMSTQQLEELFEQRVTEAVKEKEAKAAMDMDVERNRCQEIILQKNDLEQRIVAMEEDQQRSDEEKKAFMAIKMRDDLEAAIQFQVNTTAPMIASYKEGDNVLYLARIEETKFKYGHTKNLKQRIEAHGRPGVYPTFDLVWIVKSNNGVASENQLHAYVKKKKIMVEYGTQREVVLLESVDDLERMLKKMNKCALTRVDADIDMRRMEEETKRMEINEKTKQMDIIEKTKQMEITAKTKQMEINPKTMLMQMLANKTITFEQYLQIKA